MTEKAKNGKPSVWSRMRRVVITTMTGIAICGFIGAVAISVAGRYEEPWQIIPANVNCSGTKVLMIRSWFRISESPNA